MIGVNDGSPSFLSSRNHHQGFQLEPEQVTDLQERIQCNEKSFRPPFVMVRRTSRPRDRFRAAGTIIAGKQDVAVENHLLVLMPKDRTLRSCRALLKVLQHPGSSDWLNRRICCRHLTVSSLRELPWRKLMSEHLRFVHIVHFEACSSFTRITARQIARSPLAQDLKAHYVDFVARFRSPRLPVPTARQLSNLTINCSSGSFPHW